MLIQNLANSQGLRSGGFSASQGVFHGCGQSAMQDREHLDEARLATFYKNWFTAPESIDDSEFDDIHLHLLDCDVCASSARRCEERLSPGLQSGNPAWHGHIASA